MILYQNADSRNTNKLTTIPQYYLTQQIQYPFNIYRISNNAPVSGLDPVLSTALS